MGKSKDLTYNERCKIEYLYNVEHLKPYKIADKLNRDRGNLYREIKRGTVELLNTDLTTRVEYSADKAQNTIKENRANCGTKLKVEYNIKYLKYMERIIKENHFSPYCALQYIKQNPEEFDAHISKTTFYSYVKKGIFPTLKYKDLPYKKKSKKKKENENRKAYKFLKADSIEERPEEANERTIKGHWEGDTVVSAKGDKTVLLVLTERKSRFEIIRKLKDRKTETVIKAFMDITKSFNAETFKSITFDNGSEFAGWQSIKEITGSEIYFAHPYSSFERGSNENQNRIIRRFIPKGSFIKNYTEEEIKNIEKWLNKLPREIFKGKSAEIIYNET